VAISYFYVSSGRSSSLSLMHQLSQLHQLRER
jgi:hypothetical protein